MKEPPINGSADPQDHPQPSQPAPIPQPPAPPTSNPINPYWAQFYANNAPYQQYPVQGVNWHTQGPMYQQYSGYPAYTQGMPQYGQPNQYSQLSPYGQMGQAAYGQTQHPPPGIASMQAPTTAPTKKEKKRDRKKKERAEPGPGKQANALPTLPPSIAPAAPVNKHKDKKIMLPGPTPSPEYMEQAAEEPFVIDPPDRVLVILDLNGTLIFRPNPRHQATRLVARPFLKPFLRYLFENFSVIVWSSAKPENVKVIVENVLDDDLRSMLVACLARDSFNLQPQHYSMNVQVYKDLNIIWEKEEIQEKIPDYQYGKRFGQHNTVLIDDSTIKAVGQPHNLLLIPEFCGTAEQMEGDVLREVAGYLEVLKMQWDVSKFMRKEPFKADGRWAYDWEWEAEMDGGELKQKVSLVDSAS